MREIHKIRKISKDTLMVERTDFGAKAHFHKRNIELSIINKKGSSRLVFRNGMNNPNHLPLAHSTVIDNVTVSTLNLSTEALFALRDVLNMHLNQHYKASNETEAIEPPSKL